MEVKVALGESVLMQITSDMQWRRWWRVHRPARPARRRGSMHTMRAMQLARGEGWHAYLSRARTLDMRGRPSLSGTVKNNPVSYHYSSATPMHFQFEQMQFQLQF